MNSHRLIPKILLPTQPTHLLVFYLKCSILSQKSTRWRIILLELFYGLLHNPAVLYSVFVWPSVKVTRSSRCLYLLVENHQSSLKLEKNGQKNWTRFWDLFWSGPSSAFLTDVQRQLTIPTLSGVKGSGPMCPSRCSELSDGEAA